MGNKSLLTAASLAALMVGTSGAFASAPVVNIGALASESGVSQSVQGSGLVVDLLSRTGGVVTPASIESALKQMFASLSYAEAQKLPGLMRDIHGLGWSKGLESAAANTMVDLLASSSELSDDADFQVKIAELIGASATGDAITVRIAQAGGVRDGLCLYRPSDPRYRLDPDCPPLQTGRIGTGGGYRP
jgi:hypothetical protein